MTGLTTEAQKAEAGPGDEVKMSKETQSKVASLRYCMEMTSHHLKLNDDANVCMQAVK